MRRDPIALYRLVDRLFNLPPQHEQRSLVSEIHIQIYYTCSIKVDSPGAGTSFLARA